MKIETLDGWFDSRQGRYKIAAAIVTGVVGVAGAVASGVSSSKAADAQTEAANHAADLQQQQYQQTRADQAPYRQAGTTALSQIGSDFANGTGFAKSFNMGDFYSDPGYQFQLQQGNNAIQSSAAARGGLLSGGMLKGIANYTTGLANTTYGDAYNRYLATSTQKYNQLLGVAGLGESATANTGAAGAAAANASGNYITQAGNAEASGDVAVGNSVNAGLGSLGLLGMAGYQQAAKARSASSYAPYGANSD